MSSAEIELLAEPGNMTATLAALYMPHPRCRATAECTHEQKRDQRKRVCLQGLIAPIPPLAQGRAPGRGKRCSHLAPGRPPTRTRAALGKPGMSLRRREPPGFRRVAPGLPGSARPPPVPTNPAGHAPHRPHARSSTGSAPAPASHPRPPPEKFADGGGCWALSHQPRRRPKVPGTPNVSARRPRRRRRYRPG